MIGRNFNKHYMLFDTVFTFEIFIYSCHISTENSENIGIFILPY